MTLALRIHIKQPKSWHRKESMDSLIVSDNLTKLKEEIRNLRNEIAILLQEKAELEEVEIPSLQAAYAEKIGDLENRIRYQQLMVEELKYRIVLLQAALNREEKVSQEEVDEKVEQVYRTYQEKAEEEFRKADEAKKQEREAEERRKQNEEKYRERAGRSAESCAADAGSRDCNKTTGSRTTAEEGQKDTEDAREDKQEFGNSKDEFKGMSLEQKVRELYRRIVKKLHPDMNPDITPHEKELWNKAQKAYKEKDLETLERIYAEITNGEAEAASDRELSMEELIVLRDRLLKQRELIIGEIEQLKWEFPYTEKEFLENEEAVAAKREELQETIRAYEELIRELGERLKALQEKMDAGSKKS